MKKLLGLGLVVAMFSLPIIGAQDVRCAAGWYEYGEGRGASQETAITAAVQNAAQNCIGNGGNPSAFYQVVDWAWEPTGPPDGGYWYKVKLCCLWIWAKE